MTKISLMAEAHRLRRHALARSSRSDLDEKTSMWIVRQEAWQDFMMSSDFLNYVQFTPDGHRAHTLLGLPVRLTIDDAPDAPAIQLVMEPAMYVPRPVGSAQL